MGFNYYSISDSYSYPNLWFSRNNPLHFHHPCDFSTRDILPLVTPIVETMISRIGEILW